MKFSQNLQNLPSYLFAEIDRQKRLLRSKGADLIDLSIGDPDLMPSDKLVNNLKGVLSEPSVHHYPSYVGSLEFRKAASTWLQKRHNANVNPEDEVIALIGSKEGIAHLTLGTINTGDIVLVPSPGYPTYSQATILVGGSVYEIELSQENGFLPDLSKVPEDILKKAKILYLNYPNNPTSSCATKEFFEHVISFAKKYDFLICHDAAYIEIFSGKEKPISILSIEGAKDVAIEFHSFSKTFSIAGWRIGFAVGNKHAIGALAKVKQNIDSGVFSAIERSAIFAMQKAEDYINEINKIYAKRREKFVNALEKVGFKVWPSKSTFYVWTKYPDKINSIEFCKNLMEKASVVATPGVGFGKYGEGYVRFSLTAPEVKLKEAIQRISKL